jgi:hypothetical protein
VFAVIKIKIMEIEKKQDIKQQLISAQENFVVCIHESEKELKQLYTEGSIFLNKPIEKDSDMETASSVVARITKKHKEIEEQRLSVTRILDSVKSEWIDRQKNLLSETLELKKELSIKNNNYLTEKQLKAQKELEKIELEKNIKIERETIGSRISNCIENALASEISDVSQKMAISWARLTSDIFEERISILKHYKPKVTYDKVLAYIDFNPNYINAEEFDGIVKKIFDYENFCTRFEASFLNIKNIYLSKIDSKREEIKNQSSKEREELEEKTQKELIEQKAKELIAQKEREQNALIEEKNKAIKIEMEHVVVGNSIPTIGGRTNWTAYIEGNVDWNKLIKLYSDSEGFEKLEFILKWLCKNGRPQIEGIKYESSKIKVNKI